MTEELDEQFRAAVKAATATLGDVARAIRRSRRTLMFYLSGGRRVTRDAADNLATYLRLKSQKLADMADRLEDAIEGEDSDG